MPRYTEEEARVAIADSESFSDALRRLGAGRYRRQRQGPAQVGRAMAHLDEPLRSLGRQPPFPAPHADPARQGPRLRVDVLALAAQAPPLQLRPLKQRACELCGQDELWHGRRMSLVLDHVNGVPDDSRLENLRIVCPNCAATLDTHCGRKNRRLPDRASCLRCGAEFVPRDLRHGYCSRYCGMRSKRVEGLPKRALRRVERPPYEQLLREIAETSYVAVGRKYGVSDNAIRKWVRQYERELGLLSEVAAGPEALREVAAAGSSSARVGRRAR
jgi:hypothetical protein